VRQQRSHTQGGGGGGGGGEGGGGCNKEDEDEEDKESRKGAAGACGVAVALGNGQGVVLGAALKCVMAGRTIVPDRARARAVRAISSHPSVIAAAGPPRCHHNGR
jgi:hypothetical protein